MHGHPSMHIRNEQGKVFLGEEGKQIRRTIERELKVNNEYTNLNRIGFMMK